MSEKLSSKVTQKPVPQSLSYPFLRSEFLQALEDSLSACVTTGWLPLHIEYHDARQQRTLPLYLKEHSMGEYVFDYAWANAYHQHGISYYPKLVSAVPFTPSVGPRLTGSPTNSGTIGTEILTQICSHADTHNASSWHLLFPDSATIAVFNMPHLLHRTGVQYHWYNRDYAHFDDYLTRMTSRKRKMVRRERKAVSAQNIVVSMELGDAISPSVWKLFYQLYERTYAKRNGSHGYLTEAFFQQISGSMSNQIAMAVARVNNEPVACALYFYDDACLYGRYWGSLGDYDCLHFELCYYSGIEFAIDKGLRRFDAGAQGEHKIVRGFEPVETTSVHWIRHDEFRKAIRRFTEQEHLHIQDYITQAKSLLPYK
jgi:predicted N-acyltransferase